MWQSGFRRNANKPKKKEQSNSTKHMKRVAAQVKIGGGMGLPPQMIQARILLNDIKPTQVDIFATQPILVGQSVALTLDEPKRFYARARVVACKEVPTERKIITPVNYNFRMGLDFIIESQAEENALKDFYHEISTKYLNSSDQVTDAVDYSASPEIGPPPTDTPIQNEDSMDLGSDDEAA